jgi:NADH:ubiquinone oxidoreductase subunit 3 (subunit A)
MIIIGPLLIIIANFAVYLAIGRLGKRSSGKGKKFEQFAGGEEAVPTRGLYRTELFVFAVLFLIVETFALLLSGSFEASSSYYPLLFLGGGGAVMLVAIWWFLKSGGGSF